MDKLFKIILTILVSLFILITIYTLFVIIRNKLSYQDALYKINNIKGVETCESIPNHVFNTFLIFNPSNYQTYYFKSECYQKLAVRMKDENLCGMVKEHKVLLLDGSGISSSSCKTEVQLAKYNKGYINNDTYNGIFEFISEDKIYVKGKVIDHIGGCEYDLSCELIIEVNDKKVALVYNEGETGCRHTRAAKGVRWEENVNIGSIVEAYGYVRTSKEKNTKSVYDYALTFCDSDEFYINVSF